MKKKKARDNKEKMTIHDDKLEDTTKTKRKEKEKRKG